MNDLICVCCLLDPRFKDQCINADDLDLVKAKVTEATEILVKLGPEESQLISSRQPKNLRLSRHSHQSYRRTRDIESTVSTPRH